MPAIVLAGERPGGNPLARAFGAPAGVLVDVAGCPCIERVLQALEASENIAGGVVVGPARDVAAGEQMQHILANRPFDWLEPADGPAESALRGVTALEAHPVLLTSADHALLTGPIVDAFCTAASAVEADFVAGLVPYPRVQAAFPESRRTRLRFVDGTFCGSNLFLVRTAAGAAALELWRSMQAHRKRPWRMARELGVTTLVRYAAGRLALPGVLDILSRAAGCRISYVPVTEPRAAVDVDSVDDHALAERVLSSC